MRAPRRVPFVSLPATFPYAHPSLTALTSAHPSLPLVSGVPHPHPPRSPSPSALPSQVEDVYFAEVCLLSTICTNTDDLFSVNDGEPFFCQLDRSAYDRFFEWLRSNR